MLLEGYLHKEGKLWVVFVPLLGGAITQGRTRTEAFEMAKDWLDTLIDNRKIQVSVIDDKDLRFYITASDPSKLYPIILRQLRQAAGLSVREASARMGSSSPNAFGLYEQGKAIPSLQKFAELLDAVDPGKELILKRA